MKQLFIMILAVFGLAVCSLQAQTVLAWPDDLPEETSVSLWTTSVADVDIQNAVLQNPSVTRHAIHEDWRLPQSIVVVDEMDQGVLGSQYMIFRSPSELPQTIFVEPGNRIRSMQNATINLPEPPPGYALEVTYVKRE